MREYRSGSQILFGYLPEQTVDLSGRVWKVRRWSLAIPVAIDDKALREELISQATAWERAGQDDNFVNDLRRDISVNVKKLNRDAGVQVAPYPRVWLCKRCSRASTSVDVPCRCGAQASWGQLHFVGYHDCGALREPQIPRCPQHGDARVVFPGTASAAEIRIDCPVCGIILRTGLGFFPCACGLGNGRGSFTVHRAARVYTPRSVVIVNPPTQERVRELREAGGPARALQWVADGMLTRSPRELGRTRSSFLGQLLSQGFDQPFAETMVAQAIAAGQVAEDSLAINSLSPTFKAEAESQAVKVAMALSESRMTVAELAATATSGSSIHHAYTTSYPSSINAAGLEAVEFVDRFPVLTGHFGFTRGDHAPGRSRLRPFRERDGTYVTYADVAQTEAILFRFSPTRIATWLERRGFQLPSWEDSRSARLAIFSTAVVPPAGGDPPVTPTVGSELLTLLHSFSHRLIRRASVLAGLDRNSLSEFLVPLHLDLFVFAAARGGFVLGGLQALFETDLNLLLDEVLRAEHRCPLDPGCQRSGSSCAACLHLGEPSCRFFNRFLDRDLLYGRAGFLQVH